MYNVSDFNTVSARCFWMYQLDAIEARKAAGLQDHAQVDIIDPKISDIETVYLVSFDGLCGAYVKEDGYMGGLFKHPECPMSNVAKILQKIRIEKYGGFWFDCFDTLSPLYSNNGFMTVAKLKFNPDFAPENWENSTLSNKPDVCFMVYDKQDVRSFVSFSPMYVENWNEGKDRAIKVGKIFS